MRTPFYKQRADAAAHYRRDGDFVQIIAVYPDDLLGPTYDVVREGRSEIIRGVRGPKSTRFAAGNSAFMRYFGGSHYYLQLEGIAGGYSPPSILSKMPDEGIDAYLYVQRAGSTLSGTLETEDKSLEVNFVDGLLTFRQAAGVFEHDGDLELSSAISGQWGLSELTHHGARHENSGADEINVEGLSGLLTDAQKIAVRKNYGANVGTRPRLHLSEGTNITLSLFDNPGDDETIVFIGATGGVGGTSNHAELDNLDYDHAGHTGFEPAIAEGLSSQYWRGDKTWQTIAAGAAGNSGNIQFNSSGALAGDDALFWDNTNKRLGIGTASPTHPLHLFNSTNDGTGDLIIETFQPGIQFKDRSTAGTQGNFRIFNDTGSFRLVADAEEDGTYETAALTCSNAGILAAPPTYNNNVGSVRYVGINSNGVLGYISSSRASKENIQYLDNKGGFTRDSINWLYDLKPVKFDYKGFAEENQKGLIGLIAEDVAEVNPKLVSFKRKEIKTYEDGSEGNTIPIIRYEDTTEPETVLYEQLIVPLLIEVQSLRAELEGLKARAAGK